MVLDYRRLGKQRVEAKQIIDIIEGRGKVNKNGTIAWANHPAVRMWHGYVDFLKLYHNVVIEHWISRGYNNNMSFFEIRSDPKNPWWFGLHSFHVSHRSNLLRKNFGYYKKYFLVNPNLEYVWPVDGKIQIGV